MRDPRQEHEQGLSLPYLSRSGDGDRNMGSMASDRVSTFSDAINLEIETLAPFLLAPCSSSRQRTVRGNYLGA